MFSGCALIDSMKQTKKYVSIHEMDYEVYGRYEISKEYISFSCSGVSVTFIQQEDELFVWLEDETTNSQYNLNNQSLSFASNG